MHHTILEHPYLAERKEDGRRKTEEGKRRGQLIDLMDKIWQEGGLGGGVSREPILPIPAKLLEMEIDTCQCASG